MVACMHVLEFRVLCRLFAVGGRFLRHGLGNGECRLLRRLWVGRSGLLLSLGTGLGSLVHTAEFVINREGNLVVLDGRGRRWCHGGGWCALLLWCVGVFLRYSLLGFLFGGRKDGLDVGQAEVYLGGADVDAVDKDKVHHSDKEEKHQRTPFDEMVALLGNKVAGHPYIVPHHDVALTPAAEKVAQYRRYPHHPEQGAPECFIPRQDVASQQAHTVNKDNESKPKRGDAEGVLYNEFGEVETQRAHPVLVRRP